MEEGMSVKKRNLNVDEIYNIAEAFYMAIYEAKNEGRFQHRDRMSNFPGGCCDDASDLLAYYLLEKYNIHTEQGNGVYRDDNPEHTTNHAWLILNGESYIDITATQFMFCGAFTKDVYVGKLFYFYEELEDVKIYRNCDITQNERLWKDYQIIKEYLPDDLK